MIHDSYIRKRNIKAVLDGLFLLGMEMGSFYYPESKDHVIDEVEATLRKLYRKEFRKVTKSNRT